MNSNLRLIKKLMATKETRAFVISEALQMMATGWIASTYVLFILSKDLTLFHANLLDVAFMTLGFLLDPSTGKLADSVGQRRVYLWGQLAWGMGMLIYGTGNVFSAFLAAECMAAVGHALISEALESWLRNTIDKDLCHEAISFSKGFASLVSIPTAILGGIIGARFGLAWPWRAAFLSCLLSVFVSWILLRRFPKEKGERGEKTVGHSVFSVIKLVWKTLPLRFTVIVAFGVSAAVQPFNMFWTAVLKGTSGSAWWLGFVWMGIASATAVGSFFAARIREKGISKATFVIGLPMIIPYLFPKTLPILGGFLSHEIGRGAIRPLLFSYSNQFIENEYRSTANSVRSSAWGMGAALGLAVSGVLTFWYSPLQIWCFSAFALLGIAIYAWRKQ